MPLRSPLETLNAGFDVMHAVRQQGTENRHRNPKREHATPVAHRIIGLYNTSSDDQINPSVIDRTVTHMTVMVSDPQNWFDGDLVTFNNGAIDLTYEIEGNTLHENRGPITRFNRLFGGHFTAKLVGG
jgi:hypothetical protein